MFGLCWFAFSRSKISGVNFGCLACRPWCLWCRDVFCVFLRHGLCVSDVGASVLPGQSVVFRGFDGALLGVNGLCWGARFCVLFVGHRGVCSSVPDSECVCGVLARIGCDGGVSCVSGTEVWVKLRPGKKVVPASGRRPLWGRVFLGPPKGRSAACRDHFFARRKFYPILYARLYICKNLEEFIYS